MAASFGDTNSAEVPQTGSRLVIRFPACFRCAYKVIHARLCLLRIEISTFYILMCSSSSFNRTFLPSRSLRRKYKSIFLTLAAQVKNPWPWKQPRTISWSRPWPVIFSRAFFLLLCQQFSSSPGMTAATTACKLYSFTSICILMLCPCSAISEWGYGKHIGAPPCNFSALLFSQKRIMTLLQCAYRCVYVRCATQNIKVIERSTEPPDGFT